MNENSTKCYGVISDILWIFGLMKKYCPAALFLTAVEIIMRVLQPFLGIILSKVAVDIVTGDTGMNLRVFITAAVCLHSGESRWCGKLGRKVYSM